MTNKTTTQTLESSLTERHILNNPTVGTSLACIPWINLNQLSTSSQNLVGQHLDKISPRCVTDTFSEMMIFNHILNLKFLNRNGFIITNDLKRSFMKKVLSLIKNSLMKPSNLKSGFSSVSTSFFLLAQSSLKFRKFLLDFLKSLGFLI